MTLDPLVLCELQAALAAGAAPAQALNAAAGTSPLAAVSRELRLGRTLTDVATDVATGDATADLLVRALGVAEHTGAGALAAVEQTLEAVRDEAALRRLLAVRTAEARGTATVLALVPLAAWILLVALDVSALRFYATPLGAASALGAGALAGGSWAWMRAMVRTAEQAARRADPLTGPSPPRSWPAAMSAGAAAGVVCGWVLHPAAGAAAAVAAAAVGARRPRRPDAGSVATSPAGCAEVIELVAVALLAGLPPAGALAAVAPYAAPPAGRLLRDAARRVAGGEQVDHALSEGGLSPLGAVLAATARWGAPASDSLRRLSAELRADRRATAEEAAERLGIALVFPTTLLTLPAFVLGVVPPLLWTTLSR